MIGLRKYVSDLNRGFQRELLVSLPVEGGVEHFATGTEDPAVARARGLEWHDELIRDGAAAFRLSHAREVTVAVFWHANPMACTYTTLLTQPAGGTGVLRASSGPPGSAGSSRGTATASSASSATAPSGAVPRTRGWRVLVVEADGGVRRALTEWLAADSSVAHVEGLAPAAAAGARGGWDLILANREQPASALRELASPEDAARPRLVTHGCFADSDAIFASFSGVSRGYVLCRVAPARLLGPLTEAFPEGPGRARPEEDRQVTRYFQSIFEPGEGGTSGPPAGLTVRELEILDLLARGFADKEVARELGISGWTVHSHLKRIFAKYGVRTRTEAVVKHLQK